MSDELAIKTIQNLLKIYSCNTPNCDRKLDKPGLCNKCVTVLKIEEIEHRLIITIAEELYNSNSNPDKISYLNLKPEQLEGVQNRLDYLHTQRAKENETNS